MYTISNLFRSTSSQHMVLEKGWRQMSIGRPAIHYSIDLYLVRRLTTDVFYQLSPGRVVHSGEFKFEIEFLCFFPDWDLWEMYIWNIVADSVKSNRSTETLYYNGAGVNGRIFTHCFSGKEFFFFLLFTPAPSYVHIPGGIENTEQLIFSLITFFHHVYAVLNSVVLDQLRCEG